MSDRDRLEAKFARLMALHLQWRKSVWTAHRLPGCTKAIEVVRARLNATQEMRIAA